MGKKIIYIQSHPTRWYFSLTSKFRKATWTRASERLNDCNMSFGQTNTNHLSRKKNTLKGLNSLHQEIKGSSIKGQLQHKMRVSFRKWILCTRKTFFSHLILLCSFGFCNILLAFLFLLLLSLPGLNHFCKLP